MNASAPAPTHTSHGSTGMPRRRARANASMLATSTGRISAMASSDGAQPGITWLTIVMWVSGPCSGGRPWSSAVTVRSAARPRPPRRSSSTSSRSRVARARPARRPPRSARRRTPRRSAGPGTRSRAGTPAARAGRRSPPPRPPRPAPGGSTPRRCAGARCRRWWCRPTRPPPRAARVGRSPSPETTITPSTSPGDPSRSARRVVPTSPSVDPSTDASTSVLLDGRPSNTRASSISAAVSAALPAASGTPAASRSATTTIWRRELPARRPTTLTRSSLPRSKRSTSTVKPRARNASATTRAASRSPGPPRAPVAGGRHDRARGGHRARAREHHVGGQALPEGRGRLSRENIASSTASTAGTNAAR